MLLLALLGVPALVLLPGLVPGASIASSTSPPPDLPAGPGSPAAGQAQAPEPEVLYPDLAAKAPPLSAAAAVLMDAETGALLYARRPHQRRPPASTTKIMTTLLALEYGDLDAQVTVSPRAAGTPGSSMGIRAGERYRLLDLLHGVMLPSGNDAAVAVAEHVSGSVGRFVALMNQRARQLGMTRTWFANPHGLTHPGHLTTAYDLALLTRAAMAQPLFAQLGCTRQARVCELESGRALTLSNTNRLLWSYAYVEAGKTGTTSAAGRCLVVVASRGGHRLIAVLLDAPNRWQDARRLLDWGFETFRPVIAGRRGERVARIEVRGGTAPAVEAVLAGDLKTVVPRQGRPRLELRPLLPGPVDAPVYGRQTLGRVELWVDGRPVAGVDAVALREVGALTPVRWTVSRLLALLSWLREPWWLPAAPGR